MLLSLPMTQLLIAVNPSAYKWELWFKEVLKKKWRRHLGRVCLYRIVDVDKDKKQSHKHGHPAGDHLGVDQKTVKMSGWCKLSA